MNERVLVTYATWAGSTAEVAQAIGEGLSEAGASVDVRPIRDVQSVDAYGAVVVGAPVRNAKLKSEAISFVRKHRQALGRLRTAYFTACIAMHEDTPANRATAAGYLAPLCEVREPVGLGLFGGKIDHNALTFPWNVMLSFVKEGPMSDGDHRDWSAIRAWAREIAPALLDRVAAAV